MLCDSTSTISPFYTFWIGLHSVCKKILTETLLFAKDLFSTQNPNFILGNSADVIFPKNWKNEKKSKKPWNLIRPLHFHPDVSIYCRFGWPNTWCTWLILWVLDSDSPTLFCIRGYRTDIELEVLDFSRSELHFDKKSSSVPSFVNGY